MKPVVAVLLLVLVVCLPTWADMDFGNRVGDSTLYFAQKMGASFPEAVSEADRVAAGAYIVRNPQAAYKLLCRMAAKTLKETASLETMIKHPELAAKVIPSTKSLLDTSVVIMIVSGASDPRSVASLSKLLPQTPEDLHRQVRQTIGDFKTMSTLDVNSGEDKLTERELQSACDLIEFSLQIQAGVAWMKYDLVRAETFLIACNKILQRSNQMLDKDDKLKYIAMTGAIASVVSPGLAEECYAQVDKLLTGLDEENRLTMGETVYSIRTYTELMKLGFVSGDRLTMADIDVLQSKNAWFLSFRKIPGREAKVREFCQKITEDVASKRNNNAMLVVLASGLFATYGLTAEAEKLLSEALEMDESWITFAVAASQARLVSRELGDEFAQKGLDIVLQPKEPLDGVRGYLVHLWILNSKESPIAKDDFLQRNADNIMGAAYLTGDQGVMLDLLDTLEGKTGRASDIKKLGDTLTPEDHLTWMAARIVQTAPFDVGKTRRLIDEFAAEAKDIDKDKVESMVTGVLDALEACVGSRVVMPLGPS